jgi:glycosyltransferase involved in cell wall biosynthesis
MRVKYICPFAVASGYSRAAQDYLMALKLAQVELAIQPLHDADSDDLEGRYHSLLPLVRKVEADWPTHVIVHTVPRYAWEFVSKDLSPPKGVKRVCMTTWETDKLPKQDAETLNEHFDLVIVPSTFCEEVFERSGVTHVEVVPHCFDPEFWRHRSALRRDNPPYVFYSVLVWGERKNPIGLLKAYFAEFDSGDHVLLRIITPHYSQDDVLQLARCMGLSYLSKVDFITKRLSEKELVAVHHESDCYVSPSRGEAWGLGAFEAACVGNHVIATRWSGWTDWLQHYDETDLIPYQLTPAVTPEVKIATVEIAGLKVSSLSPMAPTGIDGSQNWAEPDLYCLRQTMRRAYEERLPRVKDTSALREHYNYEVVGEQFKKLLEGLG